MLARDAGSVDTVTGQNQDRTKQRQEDNAMVAKYQGLVRACQPILDFKYLQRAV